MKYYFNTLCWSKYTEHLQVSRISVNRIIEGLVWHHDLVLPDQPDDNLTFPGMTFVIHLGRDHEDVVYVEYEHDLSQRTVCTPGTAYVFPGGCIRHRTVREYNITKNAKRKNERLSVVTFLTFKKEVSQEMDNKLHEQFICSNDNFKYRSHNYQQLSHKYRF